MAMRVSGKLILSVAGVVALFIFISLAQEMNRRLQVQREVSQLTSEVKKLEREILTRESLNQYFRTSAFQELAAREKLNYSRPGEKVVLLPQASLEREEPAQQAAEEAKLPTWQEWWNVFFKHAS